VQGLTADIDVRHADGKARFVAEARPMLEKVPPGPYRELLLDRLAQAIGVSAERFLTIVGPVASAAASGGASPRAQGSAAPAVAPVARRAAMSAGRGSLLRQAIQLLVHHPAIAARIAEAQRASLAELDEPGVPVLVSMLDDLVENPAQSTAQLLERWRDRPEYARLGQLAAAESLAPTPAAAAEELRRAIDKLIDHVAQGRLDALLAKSRTATLDEHEKDELRRLMARRVSDPYGGD
jgi:DNA primase